LKFLNVQFPSLSSDLVHIRPKYHPEYPIIKHPQSILIYFERPNFAPIKKTGSIIFFALLIFILIIEKSKGIHKILDRMVAGVPCIQSAVCEDITESSRGYNTEE